LDTSVILSRYAPTDEFYESSKATIKHVEDGEYAAATSVFTFVEASSVISRSLEKFPVEEKLSKDEIVAEYLKRIASIKNLAFISVGGDGLLRIGGLGVTTPLLFEIAMNISLTTSARTLDNLHLASAVLCTDIFRRKIDFFVTGDKDLLKKRAAIKEVVKASVVSPNEFAQIEGLKLFNPQKKANAG
jgi:predicted nucleic acid-binding protein